MRAFLLTETAEILKQQQPLKLVEYPVPNLSNDEILIKVTACGVCHTELDEIEGRIPASMPVIPGHQVVGNVQKTGSLADRFQPGDRVGVAWIFSCCGQCQFCLDGLENLCTEFCGTGLDRDGGYAEFMKVHQDFAFPISSTFSDVEAAPLLCAGAIGYRALRLTGISDGDSLGLIGFGGSGHLVLKMVQYSYPNSQVYVFARNPEERSFAMELGAAWSGEIHMSPPYPLKAIIDTTPVWSPVINGLENLAPGGRLVVNAIRKEPHDKQALLKLDYSRHLWQEKELTTVANITRQDITSFLELAAAAGIRPDTEIYPFEDANKALFDLKSKKIKGSKVLKFD